MPENGATNGHGGPTPLAERLADRIENFGPMSVAEYMATCLTDPTDGYYTTREPFGRSGDFVTAPEVSQMFGELIGLWCVATWQQLGEPERFVLAELGPGRGTLIADALRAASVRPSFAAAADIALLEVSPALREKQQAALAGLAEPYFVESVDEIPGGPLIVIANEFFDALPIRQFVHADGQWAERMVGIDDDGKLVFGRGGRVELEWQAAGGSSAAIPPPEPGSVLEIRPSGEAIAEALGARIAAEGGAALVVDYGHITPDYGDTLQAIYHQNYDDPLAHPGEADLTSHVDFSALAAAAAAAGAPPRPVLEQGALLARLGITERAQQLAEDKDDATREAIAAALARLVDEDQMGRLFKAMAFAPPDFAVPAFDQ